MGEQKLHQQARNAYREINNKWMRLHLRLLALCTLLGGGLEVAMFFIIRKSDMLNCSVGEYWLKYIIVPVCLISSITVVGIVVLKSKKASAVFKQYAISFLFALFAFVLSMVHSGFVAILVCAVFPVLMTIMYEDQKLTALIALLCVILQFVSGYFRFWDPDKVLDYPYCINMIILVAATFCSWFTCYFMIKFMKMKREIIIINDIERYHLQEKVNIDGLTNVGNKQALMRHLAEASAGVIKIGYFAMLDLDDFKKINDTYGHVFGDDVLRCMGDAMRNIQVAASAFRYGGDEFCISFAEVSPDAVIAEVKAIQSYLTDHMEAAGHDAPVLISVGITCYTSKKTPTVLLQQADSALYESKRKQGGQITLFRD